MTFGPPPHDTALTQVRSLSLGGRRKAADLRKQVCATRLFSGPVAVGIQDSESRFKIQDSRFRGQKTNSGLFLGKNEKPQT
jgi:hypothetical protein